jgi:phage minor structural protein
MNKFNSLKSFGYNWLNKIKYNSDYNRRLVQLLTRIGPRPIVLNKDMVQVAVLENSFDVIIEQEVGGIDEIRFSLPMNDSKRELIANEGYIQMFDDIYVIREVIDKKKSRTTEVYAEAIWYDLQYSEPMQPKRWETVTAKEMLEDVLDGTGWKVRTVAFTNKRTFEVADVDRNRLEIARQIENLFQGELWFDTQEKFVDLLDQNGTETGASVMEIRDGGSCALHSRDRQEVCVRLGMRRAVSCY